MPTHEDDLPPNETYRKAWVAKRSHNTHRSALSRKQPEKGIDSFCIGPHTAAQLIKETRKHHTIGQTRSKQYHNYQYIELIDAVCMDGNLPKYSQMATIQQLQQLQQQMNVIQQQNANLQQRSDALQNQNETIQHQNQALTTQLQAQNISHNRELDRLNTELTEASNLEMEQLTNKFDNEKVELQKQIQNALKTCDTWKRQYAKVNEIVKNSNIGVSQQRLKSFEMCNNELLNNNNSFRSQINQLQKKNSAQETKIQELKKVCNENDTQMLDLITKLEQKNKQIKKLKDKKTAYNSNNKHTLHSKLFWLDSGP